MAVRSGGNAALVSSVRQAIECPICCNPFTDPRILKCLHTFDLACLKSWAARATATAPAPLPDCMKRPASAPPPPPGVTSAVAAATAADTNKAPQAAAVGAYAPCPTCGEKFLADKVEGLPRNYIIEHIATIMKPVKTAPERFCDLTEHEQPTTAAFYCKNCTQHWQCEECFNFIHRSSKAKKHEYMSASSEHVPVPEPAAAKTLCSCGKQPTAFFCCSCQVVVCAECNTNHHQGHETYTPGFVVEQAIKHMKEYATTVSSIEEKLHQLITTHTNAMDLLTAEKEKQKQNTSRRFEHLTSAVQNLQASFLDYINSEFLKYGSTSPLMTSTL
eukprot:TRINITY_DN2887_c0_g1_i2.p1 TRINITY_DN2887_c0_g1~~TRINITY_DN2887_c0_g1_i2.p1  ORF type:complete len:331 (+),score=68.65 TRINITY_DN2887_c0_g1_i2:157-1149(+)